jgi:hypothetical protein
MPPSRNDIRNDIPDGSSRHRATAAIPCPVCATAFTPIRRQTYCTPACRQAAWRTRHHDAAPAPVVVLPPRTRRRDITIYECPGCATRRLGQQWCPDCNQPATRIDLGGLCPNCDEPITISDITDQHPQRDSHR